MSPSCYFVRMRSILMYSQSTHSQMQWNLISMSLLWSCKTGFLIREIVALLSTYNIGGRLLFRWVLLSAAQAKPLCGRCRSDNVLCFARRQSNYLMFGWLPTNRAAWEEVNHPASTLMIINITGLADQLKLPDQLKLLLSSKTRTYCVSLVFFWYFLLPIIFFPYFSVFPFTTFG